MSYRTFRWVDQSPTKYPSNVIPFRKKGGTIKTVQEEVLAPPKKVSLWSIVITALLSVVFGPGLVVK
jgi:hypothetical protein